MSEHDFLSDLSIDLEDLARQRDPPPPDRLARTVHRLVRRYCRARLATLPSGYALADDLAVRVTADLLREPRRRLDRALPVEAVVYPVMADAVTRALADASDPDRPSSPRCSGGRDEVGPASALDPQGIDVPTEVPPDLLKELDRLPRRSREVLVLRAFVGLSSEQVGRAMGLSVEKVRAEQHRALAHLRSP